MAEAGILAGLLGVVGLLVGSFLNVVIARVPEGRSIVRPGSACPACGTPIQPRDNIPLLSWVLLRGRCRTCQAPISVRYPLIELANAALWFGLAWWALAPGNPAELLPTLLVVGSAGLALAAIDLDHHRLPNAIVYPLYPVVLAGLCLAALVGPQAWLAALVGAGLWLLVIGGLWLASGGRGMGLGDVKLAPVLGAVLGWLSVGVAVIGLFTAFVLGAIVGLALMLAGRAGRRSRIPFGPYLVAGYLLAIFVGPPVWAGYLASAGL